MSGTPPTIPEIAASLVCAVKDNDQAECHDVLLRCSTDDLYALCVVLAASVRDDDRLMAQWKPIRLAFANIVDVVCEVLEIDVEEFTSARRTKMQTRARHIAAWVAASLGYSYSELGRLMHRDHSTVIHSVGVVTSDRGLLAVAEQVLEKLGPEARMAA